MGDFNPDKNIGKGIFGFPFSPEESKIQIIPVPWDVTTSYGGGASLAPEGIFKASFQLDLYRAFFPEFYNVGIAILPVDSEIETINFISKKLAQGLIEKYENDIPFTKEDYHVLSEINEGCEKIHYSVYQRCTDIMKQNKIPVVLGGDHSAAYGLIKALSEKKPGFGILQIDAHADLRESYQGFVHSHASIMYNAIQLEGVASLTQVGVRDYCTEEMGRIKKGKDTIFCFTDREMKHAHFKGATWEQQVNTIIETLPENVYVSFDVDGLSRECCPNTGTPVPGGLEFNEAMFLIESICMSGRKIIGFDLCEVAPSSLKSDEWDCNVGARILYELCMYLIYSIKN